MSLLTLAFILSVCQAAGPLSLPRRPRGIHPCRLGDLAQNPLLRPQSLIVIYCRVIRLSAAAAVIPSSIVELHTRISPMEEGEGRSPSMRRKTTLFLLLPCSLARMPRLTRTHSRCLTAFSLHRRRSLKDGGPSVRPLVWAIPSHHPRSRLSPHSGIHR